MRQAQTMMTSLLLLSCCLTLAMSQKMSHILMNMVAQDPYTRNMMRLPLFQELFDIEIPPTSEPSAKQLGAASLFGLASNGIFGGPSMGASAPRPPQTGSSPPNQSQTGEMMPGTSPWDRSSFGSGQSMGRMVGPTQFDGGYQMTGSLSDTTQNSPPQLGGSLTWPQQSNGRSFGNSPIGNGMNWPPTMTSNTQLGGGQLTSWPQQPSVGQSMGDNSWPQQTGGVITLPSFGGNVPGYQQTANIPGNTQPQWPAQTGGNQQMGNPPNQWNPQPQWPSQTGGNQPMTNPPNPGNSQPQWPPQMGGNQQMANPPNQGNSQQQWPQQTGGNQQMGNPPNQGNSQPQWPPPTGGNQQMGNPQNQGNSQPQWPVQMGGNQLGTIPPENNNSVWGGMTRTPSMGDSLAGNNQMGGPMPGNNLMGGPMPGNNLMGGPMPGNNPVGGPMPRNNQMGGPMPGNNLMGGPMPGNNQMGSPISGNNQIGETTLGNNQMPPPYGIIPNSRPKIPLDLIVQLYNSASNPTQGEAPSGNTATEGQGSQADPSTVASFSNTPRQPRAIIQAGQVILPKGPPSRNFIDRLMALGGAEGIEII